MSIAIWVIVIVLVVVLIVIDIVLVSDRVEDNTFSELLRLGGKVSTFFPWTIGVLMGHWYHPVDHLRPIIRAPWNYITLGIIALIIFVLGAVFLYALKIYTPQWFTVLFGLVIGSLLWPVEVND